jgi:hypothetical protein
MMRSLRLALSVLFALSAVNCLPLEAEHRRIEDSSVDLSSNVMRPGPCFHTKIRQNGDDDGNAYFYNGSYRAQYNRYSSFFLCQKKNGKTSCDYSQEYVSDLEGYLQRMTNYIGNLCTACASNCRRFLEDNYQDQDMDENWTVNCNTCASDCKLIFKADEEDNETNYLQCQYSHEDNNIAYYAAPACKNGQIVIGHFYDNECSVKATKDFIQDLSYNYFRTMELIEVDCSSGFCDDLYKDSLFCDGGYSANGDDDSKLCKAALEASKVRSFYKKPFYAKIHLKAFLFLGVVFGAAFSFLSYTYYVRHRRAKIPLAHLDGDNRLPEIS